MFVNFTLGMCGQPQKIDDDSTVSSILSGLELGPLDLTH